jgi:hypothetical protein
MYLNLFMLEIRIDLNLHGANQDIIIFSGGAGQLKIHQQCTSCEYMLPKKLS